MLRMFDAKGSQTGGIQGRFGFRYSPQLFRLNLLSLRAARSIIMVRSAFGPLTLPPRAVMDLCSDSETEVDAADAQRQVPPALPPPPARLHHAAPHVKTEREVDAKPTCSPKEEQNPRSGLVMDAAMLCQRSLGQPEAGVRGGSPAAASPGRISTAPITPPQTTPPTPQFPPSRHSSDSEIFEKVFGFRSDDGGSNLWDLQHVASDMDLKLADKLKDTAPHVDDDENGHIALQAAATSGFQTKGSPSNPMGYTWANALQRDGALREAYKQVTADSSRNITKRAAQESFRQNWAAQKWEATRAKRRKLEQSMEEDGFKAQYRPFSVIYREEGKDPAAFKAAINYITAAAYMMQQGEKFRNRDWCRYNSMTQRVEWLYVQEERRSVCAKTLST